MHLSILNYVFGYILKHNAQKTLIIIFLEKKNQEKKSLLVILLTCCSLWENCIRCNLSNVTKKCIPKINKLQQTWFFHNDFPTHPIEYGYSYEQTFSFPMLLNNEQINVIYYIVFNLKYVKTYKCLLKH
jgi:hypothetical protein